MRFTKTEAQGNDFIFARREETGSADPAALAVTLCDRRTGIGADGLVLLDRSERADVWMLIWNPDGSRAAVCGNALRCCALFGANSVETDAGLHRIEVLSRSGEHDVTASAGLGLPRLGEALSPAPAGWNGGSEAVTLHPVNMGNPHAVLFVDENSSVPVEVVSELLAALEKDPAFPGGTNVEWVEPAGPATFRVTVWERGAGLTGACGSGACAVHAAAVARGLAGGVSRILMPGGELTVSEAAGGELILSGMVRRVFTGEISLP